MCFDLKKERYISQILLKLWFIGNRTSCHPIQSVMILMIKRIGLPLHGHPILLITHMITDRIGLHSVLLPLLIVMLSKPNSQMLCPKSKISCRQELCPENFPNMFLWRSLLTLNVWEVTMVWGYFTHFHERALCYTDVHVYHGTRDSDRMYFLWKWIVTTEKHQANIYGKLMILISKPLSWYWFHFLSFLHIW